MQTAIRNEFWFLNRLRESGETNMFGAAPYVECAFDLTRGEAKRVLMEWMQWVEQEPSNRDL
jgi:hypothetical protein